jgi:hypothetical protein
MPPLPLASFLHGSAWRVGSWQGQCSVCRHAGRQYDTTEVVVLQNMLDRCNASVPILCSDDDYHPVHCLDHHRRMLLWVLSRGESPTVVVVAAVARRSWPRQSSSWDRDHGQCWGCYPRAGLVELDSMSWAKLTGAGTRGSMTQL